MLIEMLAWSTPHFLSFLSLFSSLKLCFTKAHLFPPPSSEVFCTQQLTGLLQFPPWRFRSATRKRARRGLDLPQSVSSWTQSLAFLDSSMGRGCPAASLSLWHAYGKHTPSCASGLSWVLSLLEHTSTDYRTIPSGKIKSQMSQLRLFPQLPGTPHYY